MTLDQDIGVLLTGSIAAYAGGNVSTMWMSSANVLMKCCQSNRSLKPLQNTNKMELAKDRSIRKMNVKGWYQGKRLPTMVRGVGIVVLKEIISW